MKKLLLFCLLMTSFIFSGCSKSPGKTDAKLKLSYSGITGLMSSHGQGGAILFGKNSTGETFGKILTDVEENLVLNNGNWTFYAVMWELDGAAMMRGVARCGKSGGQLLSGNDVTISMTLDNNICADAEFSGGSFFVDTGKKKFASQFVEECDDVNSATSTICGAGNQGSALSYRFVFNNFKQSAGGALSLEADRITSACTPLASLNTNGLAINFPSGNGFMPFVGTVEMFLGTSNCDESDPKGVYRFTLNRGLRNPNLVNHRIFESSNVCNAYTLGSIDLKNKCEAISGVFTGPSTCNTASLPEVFSRFMPVGDCTEIAEPRIALKHLVSIPKSFLCDRYLNNSVNIGTHPFAGGDGSLIRNYKICTEWQLNQIGEVNALAVLSTKHYKLMNDLDMNKADLGTEYSTPLCVGLAGSVLESHHNMNPLDKMYNSYDGITCSSLSTTPEFNGAFNGNNKTISNARILSKNTDNMGFIRVLGGSAVVKNLNFKNLEVRGKSFVGGVVGKIKSGSTNAELSNIKIYKGEIEGLEQDFMGKYIGGIIGKNESTTSLIKSVQVRDFKLRGREYVGGLVGHNFGTIQQSMFRGIIQNNYTSGSSTAQYLGGVVGYNDGFVVESFSEGAIRSVGSIIGGIVGTSPVALNRIKNVYSTMVVSSTGTANPIVGGIAGIGNIESGYFDGIVSASSTSNFRISSTYSTQNVLLINASSTPEALLKNSNDLRTDYSSTLQASDIPKWRFLFGSLPRLSWEQRECMNFVSQYSLGNQRFAGRGASSITPILICNKSQLTSLGTNSLAGEFYKIGDDINLSSWTSSSPIENFRGILDGSNKVLYGLYLSLIDDDDENVGIIKTNHGLLKNIFLIGNTITNNDVGDDSTGLLVGLNNGQIHDIKIRGGYLVGEQSVGGVAGINSGLIDNISIESSSISGRARVGGVAGENRSGRTISRASSEVYMYGYAPPYMLIGGIVGTNSGTITQVRMSGKMDFPINNASQDITLGGLVGTNLNTGNINNSYVDSYSIIKTFSIENVGGLVGFNAGGVVRNSFHLGKINYTDISPPIISDPVHATIGGGNNGTYLLYLNDTITDIFSTNPYTYETVGGSSLTTAANFTLIATFNPLDWNIAHIPNTGVGIRKNDVFNYYRAIMDDRIPPANSPIWVLEDGDEHPDLLQIDK